MADDSIRIDPEQFGSPEPNLSCSSIQTLTEKVVYLKVSSGNPPLIGWEPLLLLARQPVWEMV